MQQITPIEIRQKSFKRSFRGYSPDEVDAFLHALAYVWEKQKQQLVELKNALEASEKEVERLQALENVLMKTLARAETVADNITQQAHKEAELKVREAQIAADNLLYNAQTKLSAIQADGKKQYRHLREQIDRALVKSQQIVQEAEIRGEGLLQQLRHLAEDVLAVRKLVAGDIYGDTSSGRANVGEETGASVMSVEADPT